MGKDGYPIVKNRSIMLGHSGPAWVCPWRLHHDIIPECLWPGFEYSSSETDGRIASKLYVNPLQLAVVS